LVNFKQFVHERAHFHCNGVDIVEKRDNIQVFSKFGIFPNQGKERSDLPVTSVVAKI